MVKAPIHYYDDNGRLLTKESEPLAKKKRETFVTETGVTLPVITWPETIGILLAVAAFTVFMRTYFPGIFG